VIKAEERKKVEGWARGARRRRGPHVVYYDQRASTAPEPTRRFLAAHEVARLTHDAPRLAAIKMWSAVAEIFVVLVAVCMTGSLLAGVAIPTSVMGLVSSLVLAGVLLSWLAKAREIEFKADRYAVKVLGAPIGGSWSHPFMREGVDARPWWASPSTPWHYRYFSATSGPSDEAAAG
jgi:hypothetical protein